MTTSNRGFTWAKVEGIYYASCYAPPRWTIEDFKHMLTALELELRGKSPILIAGDFNAWSTTWGSNFTNPRGRLVEETLAAMDLVLLNTPGVYTFDCTRGRSIIDLAFADRNTANRIKWRVEETIHTQSDHLAIIIQMQKPAQQHEQFQQRSMHRKKWKGAAFDNEAFGIIWEDAHVLRTTAEDMAEQMAALLEFACDASMPRNRYSGKRQPAYWWTAEIAEIRKVCIRARRQMQRSRHRPNFGDLQEIYRARKRELKIAIQRSKRRCFKEMRDNANEDPWGLAYKTVMSKVKAQRAPQPKCPILLEQVVSALFPQQRETNNREYHQNWADFFPPVTAEEVLNAVNGIKDDKAPGPDGIPNVALKAAVKMTPHIFADLFNKCLSEGIVPTRWKLQRLVLLLKPGKQPGEPSSYRPLCMLDTIGKIFERIICGKVNSGRN